ncbi:hypothetical protein HMPREF0004_5719, partial [Achromobacter piechaudii ATCC 43553]
MQHVRLRQDRQALQQRVQAGRAQPALGFQADQFLVQRQRQFPLQPLVRHALGMVHHEL